MNRFESHSKRVTWSIALLLTALAAGCGDWNPNGNGTTGPAGGGGVPLAINLGSAVTFGIAARAGMTSTGVTVVNGDVALWPAVIATPACTDATGGPAGAARPNPPGCAIHTLPPSATGLTVNGSIWFAADPPPGDNGVTANTVTNDLNTAWTEGRNKIPNQPTVAGDQLSSVIPYAPGIYHNANLGLAGGGTATLDAGGNANAVWIFQIDTDFTDSGVLGNLSRIVLANGAQARNVWFVAGRDITIGTGTTWNGNILAGRTATINSGSTLLGRVLAGAAGAGAITLTGAAAPSVTSVTVPQ